MSSLSRAHSAASSRSTNSCCKRAAAVSTHAKFRPIACCWKQIFLPTADRGLPRRSLPPLSERLRLLPSSKGSIQHSSDSRSARIAANFLTLSRLAEYPRTARRHLRITPAHAGMDLVGRGTAPSGTARGKGAIMVESIALLLQIIVPLATVFVLLEALSIALPAAVRRGACASAPMLPIATSRGRTILTSWRPQASPHWQESRCTPHRAVRLRTATRFAKRHNKLHDTSLPYENGAFTGPVFLPVERRCSVNDLGTACSCRPFRQNA